MDTKTKILTALVALMIVGGAFALLPSALAQQEGQQALQGQQKQIMMRRLAVCRYILKNGSPVQLVGTVKVAKPGILVLSVEGKDVNVMIPGRWVVDGETVNAKDLFGGNPFKVGDSATVKTLMVEKAGNGFTVKAYIGYVIQVGEVTAKALLPFNIE
jgi:hypothetical protein